jgi:ligand-binding sensor domain-containing protein/signal transduction histidine kinase/DNA-binding response OmpR family regulator
MRISSILLFLSLVFLVNHAETGNYSFSRIDADQGLSNNQVQCVFKDSRGFIWIGTSSGLNRYDGYSFKVYRNVPGDTTSLNDNRVSYIFEDSKGKMWVGTGGSFSVYDPLKDNFSGFTELSQKNIEIPIDSLSEIRQDNRGNIWFISSDQGLFQYQPDSDSVRHIQHTPHDPGSPDSQNVTAILYDRRDFIWMIHNTGVLEKLDPHTLRVVFRSGHLKNLHNQTMDMRMVLDTDGDIWIYTSSQAIGAYLYSPEGDIFTHFHTDSKNYRLNNNIVTGLVEDDKGKIWIGTDHGGINLVHKKDFSIEQIQHNPDDERSLSQNSIISLYKDYEGIIWVGTFKKGVCYYHENLFKFSLVKHEPNNANSLPYADVNAFQEDKEGNLWIGTNGEGLIYLNRKTNRYRQYKHDPDNPESLSNNVIVSMRIDSRDRLWLGTFYGGLNLYDGTRFRHYRHIPGDTGSISDDRIWDIFEDSRGNIWIGTLGAGLDLLNKDGTTFTHFHAFQSKSVHSDYISHIAEDQKGNLWVGTAYGVDIYDRNKNEFRHLIHNPSDTNSIASNIVSYILIDSRNLVWIATYSGLTLYDPDKNSFRRFYTSDGLPDNSILGLVEDNSGNIWMSSTNGICRIMPVPVMDGALRRFQFMNFTEADGLQGKEFNDGVVFRTSRGEIIFGGADGFNIFIPERLSYNSLPPRVFITGLEIFNNEIKVGEKFNGRILLEQSLISSIEVKLKHFEDMIAFEFTALNYMHPEKNKYEYKLEGFNKTWLRTSGEERKATYTNLDPGEYIFRVRASNNDGVWNTDGAQIRLIVSPPFWKTKAAIATYIFILFALLVFFRRMILLRERIKFRNEQEKQESLRRHELDLLKIRFFTNVSHEFRTPLSLILSPLERMLKRTGDDEQKNQLNLVYRNARRLLNLVNQLLDFRRMEVQKITLKPVYGDIVEFISEIHKFFSELAEKKNIRFSYESQEKNFFTYFDHDKIEKIVFNLLSNAFKFTPEGGSITLTLRISSSPEAENGVLADTSDGIIIQVRDSGIGISEANKEKIFERFFQNEENGSMVNQGSGIGLSLTKEFVNLHMGKIEVESTEGKGSTFTVYLPLVKPETAGVQEDTFESHEVNEDVVRESVLEETVPKFKKPGVLLVEDNDDFRFYLKDNLNDRYIIIEAANGKEGIQQAVTHLPDLIVSDVMMPEMDGIELCRLLKTNPKTSHIPVILLTARMSEDMKQEGFETGADDYITKPFSFEILEARMNNLIMQRERLKLSFQKFFRIEPGEIGITSLDEKLMTRALDMVEKHLGDSDFSVEKLSRELGMSRVHLYKKLTALTGKTPIEFIRIMRLKRAAQYLEKSQMTIAEVAFEVGFNDPRYFSRYFKAEFGMLPSQYIQQKIREKS